MLLEKIRALKATINEKREAYNTSVTEVRSLAESGDLEKAQELKADIEAKKEELEALQSNLTDLEEINGYREVDPPTEKSAGGAGENRSILDNDPVVADFDNYIRTKGSETRSLNSVEAGVLIPENIINKPQETPETVVDLSKFVNRQAVTTPAGSYPVVGNATDEMVDVEELAKNPALAKPNFKKIDYKVKTYRGSIPISQEAIDDSEADLLGIVQKDVKQKELNTSNAKISEVLKTFTATAAASLDDIKKVLNVTIDPAYNISIVATSSMYQVLDTLKDKNGQYILKQDITSPSGMSISGRPLHVVSDKLLGKDGETKAFIGDMYRGVLFADRKQLSVRWVENEIYGQILASYVRFDVRKADDKAGVFVTWKEVAGTA
ncbi:phage major capsid protein [Listeria booriae]|uniref:Phage major capsid protein n=1 Tax=Listeria booriae TaxID=1552123 RepID=A0A841YQQ3_9LIST|nr:phage major capsid protein [Listeria booriae]MBC1402137.1 phage major capsid protein [Listeria booriae]MBC1617869.1 phage major capsid protein [Listeria booriae]